MTASPWPMWIAAIVLAVGATALLAWSLWGDRARRPRRRCPGCWYDMSATPGRLCPECGRKARSERAMGKRRRRWRWAMAAVVLALAAAGAAVTPTVRKRGLVGLVPTTGYFIALPWMGTPSNAVQNELYRRMDTGPLPVWQRRLLFSRCDAVLRSSADDDAKVYALRLIEHVGWRGGYSGRPTREAGDAAPVLINAILNDPVPGIRAFAAGIIRTTGGEPGPIVEALATVVRSDASGDVRRRAVGSLYEFSKHGRPAIPAVLECLDFRGTPYLRRDAVILLRYLGADDDGRVLATLVESLNDAEEGVAYSAAEAIGWLGAAGRPATGALITASSASAEGLVRKFAVMSLGAVADASDPAVVEAVAARMDDAESYVADAAVLTLLRMRPGEEGAKARIAAALDLWTVGRAATIVMTAAEAGLDVRGLERFVVRMLHQARPDDWETPFYTCRFLCRAGYADAAILPAIAAAHESARHDRVRVWTTLLEAQVRGNRTEAVAPLIDLLRRAEADWYTRGDSAEALGLIGPAAAAAVPLLEPALADEAWHSRECAREALRLITGRVYGVKGERMKELDPPADR